MWLSKMDQKETKRNRSKDLELGKKKKKPRKTYVDRQQKSTFVPYGFRLCYIFPVTVKKIFYLIAIFHTHLRCKSTS